MKLVHGILVVMMKLLAIFVVTLSPAVSEQHDENHNDQKPNIVVLIVDDLGYNDIGPESLVRTPNIDLLLKDSAIELKRHYAYSWCAPSRASFMVGREPVHNFAQHTSDLAVDPSTINSALDSAYGANPKMSTIFNWMKIAGYSTIYHGKWGAGHTIRGSDTVPGSMPENRGIDSFFGYLSDSIDYYKKDLNIDVLEVPNICSQDDMTMKDLWEANNEKVGQPAYEKMSEVWVDFQFTEQTINAIRVHDEKDPDHPLFLTHAFHSIHTPLDPPMELSDEWYPLDSNDTATMFKEHPELRNYATMVTYVDYTMKNIIKEIKKKPGMWENTILLFTSDNGGPIYAGKSPSMFGGANNFPLRGGKTSDWEGGHRAIAFLAGGVVETQAGNTTLGKSLDGIISIADWYTTFAMLAGIENVNALEDLHADKMQVLPVDGKNQWPYLMGRVTSSPREDYGFLLSDTSYVKGNFKLLCGNGASIAPDFSGSFMLSVFEEALVPPSYLMKYDVVNTSGVGAEAVQNYLHVGRDCTPNITTGKPCCMFDLSTDVSESNDLMHVSDGGCSDVCPTSTPYYTEPTPQIGILYAKLYAEYLAAKEGIWNPSRGEVQNGTCEALWNAGGFATAFWNAEEKELDVSYPNGTAANVDLPYWPGTKYEY